MNILIPILFCVVAVVIMGAALHFSKYKKRKSGCGCGRGESIDDAGSCAKTCDHDAERSCVCD